MSVGVCAVPRARLQCCHSKTKTTLADIAGKRRGTLAMTDGQPLPSPVLRRVMQNGLPACTNCMPVSQRATASHLYVDPTRRAAQLIRCAHAAAAVDHPGRHGCGRLILAAGSRRFVARPARCGVRDCDRYRGRTTTAARRSGRSSAGSLRCVPGPRGRRAGVGPLLHRRRQGPGRPVQVKAHPLHQDAGGAAGSDRDCRSATSPRSFSPRQVTVARSGSTCSKKCSYPISPRCLGQCWQRSTWC